MNFKNILALITINILIFSILISSSEKKSKSFNYENNQENKENLDKNLEKKDTISEQSTNNTEVNKKQSKKSAKKEAKSYILFAKLPYCMELQACTTCQVIKSSGYETIISEKTKSGEATINLVINRNTSKKETIISFSGPKSDNLPFIQTIYINGFSDEASKYLNTPIEKVFWEAYSSIKTKLVKSISEILLKNEDEKIIFVGHSFGGSLAILASYDLKKSNILSKLNKIKLITFAALKIGDVNFIKLVHSVIPFGIIRLRRIYDYYYYIPRCVYIPELDVFHCYTSYVGLIGVWPVFARYLYYYSPVIRTKISMVYPGLFKTQMAKARPNIPSKLKALPNKNQKKEHNSAKKRLNQNRKKQQYKSAKNHNHPHKAHLIQKTKSYQNHWAKNFLKNGKTHKNNLSISSNSRKINNNFNNHNNYNFGSSTNLFNNNRGFMNKNRQNMRRIKLKRKFKFLKKVFYSVLIMNILINI